MFHRSRVFRFFSLRLTLVLVFLSLIIAQLLGLFIVLVFGVYTGGYVYFLQLFGAG